MFITKALCINYRYQIKRFSMPNLIIVILIIYHLFAVWESKKLFPRLIESPLIIFLRILRLIQYQIQIIYRKMLASQTLVLKEFLNNSLIFSQQNMQKSPSKKAFSPIKPLYQFFIGQAQKKERQNSKGYQSPEKLLLHPNHFQNSLSTSASNSNSREKIFKIQNAKIKFQKVKEKYEKSYEDIKKGTVLKNIKKIGLKNNQSYSTNINTIPIIQANEIANKAYAEPSKIEVTTKVGHEKEFKVLKISDSIQTFQIIKYIDEGSYGKVHLVQHLKTQSLYCLKTIAKKNISEECIHQLVRQTIIQSYLNHPNIVNLYSFSADVDNFYLLLEACPGQNLYKRLQKQKFSEKEVRKFIKQVSTAVQYLHKNNIIHRDIKPENIIIHENTVKLCDFGWAIHSPYLRKTQCGTPVYTSPEMVKSEYYDNKIDIWCIGILTYELLFGDIPFQIRNLNDLPKIVKEQIFFPKESNITDQAKNFIKKCLEKNANERYNIRQVLEDDFLTTKIERPYRNTYS